ncbi:hypothetical protein DFA_07035 [Cavenderia fasciculata]|uniref:tRNA-splicing endonuclease subunit Sen15 domain-containing protein n=1 Tax=Cavenderia fasciculata TaxID=261658 RepID=F4PVB3_CACFS|nr:uncharacterized protein DFA_07035 [Cavenderia fasciculata]EGG19927.1 hypothetical protein DFA_07035 [Cavenderia fasciculata]|eukprot:XP_004366910.1 hypothetical protein DFA_07035 [Cavenderia fasciculata]
MNKQVDNISISSNISNNSNISSNDIISIESLVKKYNNECSIDKIHLAYQVYVDLKIVKKWFDLNFQVFHLPFDQNKDINNSNSNSKKDNILILKGTDLENKKDKHIILPFLITENWSFEKFDSIVQSFHKPKDTRSGDGGDKSSQLHTSISNNSFSCSYLPLSFVTALMTTGAALVPFTNSLTNNINQEKEARKGPAPHKPKSIATTEYHHQDTITSTVVVDNNNSTTSAAGTLIPPPAAAGMQDKGLTFSFSNTTNSDFSSFNPSTTTTTTTKNIIMMCILDQDSSLSYYKISDCF